MSSPPSRVPPSAPSGSSASSPPPLMRPNSIQVLSNDSSPPPPSRPAPSAPSSSSSISLPPFPSSLRCEYSDTCPHTALIHCPSCESNYCESHDASEHANKRRADHARNRRKFTCDADDSHSAAMYCSECPAPGLFCAACDDLEHQNQKRRHHVRRWMKDGRMVISQRSASPPPAAPQSAPPPPPSANPPSALKSPRAGGAPALSRPKSVAFLPSEIAEINGVTVASSRPPLFVGGAASPTAGGTLKSSLKVTTSFPAQSPSSPPASSSLSSSSSGVSAFASHHSLGATSVPIPKSPSPASPGPVHSHSRTVAAFSPDFLASIRSAAAPAPAQAADPISQRLALFEQIRSMASTSTPQEVQKMVRTLPIDLQAAIIQKGTEKVVQKELSFTQQPQKQDPLASQRLQLFEQIKTRRTAEETMNLMKSLPPELQAAIIAKGVEREANEIIDPEDEEERKKREREREKHKNNPRLIVKTRTKSDFNGFNDGGRVFSEPGSPYEPLSPRSPPPEPLSPRERGSVSKAPKPQVATVIERVQTVQRVELSQENRELLRRGVPVTRHKKHYARDYFIYSAVNDEYICFVKGRERMQGFVPNDKRFHLANCNAIRSGRTSDPLKKKTLLGKYVVAEEKCFTIVARRDNESSDIEIDFECESADMRDRLVAALNQAAEAKREIGFTKFVTKKIVVTKEIGAAGAGAGMPGGASSAVPPPPPPEDLDLPPPPPPM